MIDFSKAYNRADFVNYLRRDFLPDDFEQEEKNVPFWSQMNYASVATCLGKSKTLNLVVYEIKHRSPHDARVGLSKDAFRMLAGEKQNRALVIFVPEDNSDNYRFSLIEIQLSIGENDSNVTRTYSNPRRYSYYLGKGIACYTPNKYLNELGRVKDVKDLFERFSVEVLTKAFYQELSDWYAWAIKVISFPNDISTRTDDKLHNHEGVIRLITRLIFVWFLKERKLIPWQFFDQEYIANHLIKGFNPHKIDNLFGKSEASVYYRAILQNLFFAMLNCPITKEGSTEFTERRFKDNRSQFDDNKLMRYRDEFNNPDEFLRLANETVPFLNGGLFDCLDEKRSGMYYDGFSERKESMAQLIVPDYLFFGEEAGKNIDLSEFYGDANKKKVSARGIIDIFKRYNFTVEENMPFDKDVSLDPELLGKVFENLLAAYIPETSEIVRKNTGSFYTPREIVQYMVDESLVAHLKRTVGNELEGEYRKLLDYADNETSLTEQQKLAIMRSLYNCKILDPACGSGAFPVGVLQQMVHILTKIDPDNSRWQKMLFDITLDENSSAYQSLTKEEQVELKDDLYRSFNENFNRPDYSRKLYLIENCIYGVDIQPIAIQISKLRFFISLIIDQKINNNPADNFGIRPLPNLEAKFVAANSLISLNRKKATLFDSDKIKDKEAKLKIAKHKIFSAKTSKTKEKYREQVRTLRKEIADLLIEQRMVGNEQAQQLEQWDMFDQNASSPFFDPEWMFGVKGGFDLIIGNPPYNELRDLTKSEQNLYKSSQYFEYAKGGRLNMFQFFYPLAINLIIDNGICCFITQNSLLAEESALNNRKQIFKICNIIKIDSFPERDNPKLRVFESAKMSVCICLLSKGKKSNMPFDISIWKDKYMRERQLNKLTISDITTIYPDDLVIPICSSENWNLLIKMRKHKQYTIIAQAGEIDMTKYRVLFKEEKGTDELMYRVLTGAQILRYHITDKPSQGKIIYLNSDLKLSNDRVQAISNPRIVMQRITGVDSNIRIISTLIPPNMYCANSTNYISPHKNNIDIYYLLGILNSKCINFFFKQTSTNTNVTGKEIAKFPIPIASKEIQNFVSELSRTLMTKCEKKICTDAEIKLDLVVSKLYDLTYDEVLIVDPDSPISREEYDNFKI